MIKVIPNMRVESPVSLYGKSGKTIDDKIVSAVQGVGTRTRLRHYIDRGVTDGALIGALHVERPNEQALSTASDPNKLWGLLRFVWIM